MICDECGTPLRHHRSKWTRKREVWGCPAKGCSFTLEMPLWPTGRLELDRDAPRVHEVHADRPGLQKHWFDPVQRRWVVKSVTKTN